MAEAGAAATVATPNSSSHHPPRIQAAAPVRVVAKICPGGGSGGSFHVAAHVSDAADSSSAVVSFTPILKEKQATTAAAGAMTPRKDYKYMLDYCYLKDDSYTRIFHSEVKQLVDGIFDGHGNNNACIVTCGATDKTHLIMGSEDQPGLLIMAMEQILHHAKPIGAAVSVSSYQVLEDTDVFDSLEPKDKGVRVLIDADGRTRLNGLSRVDIKSIEEFVDICGYGSSNIKHHSKASDQLEARGHQGFVIYISWFDQQGRECTVAKIHFLDLAGYVDPKQKLAPPNSNKPLYAVMDVVQALNSNKNFISYRQSILTRILQDSLCKTSGVVLIACLDEVCSQDAVSTVSLASRSSQVVNKHCFSLSLGSRSCSKLSAKLPASAKNLSRSLLPSINQPSSLLEKRGRPKFMNSTIKASQTPTTNKRSEATLHSTKGPVTTVSTSTNMKRLGSKSILSGRKLFCPSTNSSKEDKIFVVPTVITKAEEIQSSLGTAIPASSPSEGCDDAEKIVEVVSSEMPEMVPCSMKELVLSGIQEKDHSSSDLHVDHSCTDLDMTCSSDAAGEFVEKTPMGAIQSSPKPSDRLREISNSLKLLSTRPVNIPERMVCAQPFNAEPKTPVHLKFGYTEDLQESLKARSTGVKKSLAQDCLAFLNSANKEELKSLKGIGEKRANYILELRERSPVVFKEIDDLKDILRMNKTEIKNMMSGMIMDS